MSEQLTMDEKLVPMVTIASKTVLDKSDGKGLKAYVDLLIAGLYKVKKFRIVQDSNGELFLGMPQSQEKDGTWSKTFYPANKTVGQALEKMVLAQYKFGKGGNGGGQ